MKILRSLLLLLLILLPITLFKIQGEVVKIEDYSYYQTAQFAQVKGGFYFAAGLTNDGRLFTWGQNGYGQLGTGNTSTQTVPKDITPYFNLSEGEYITYFDVGSYHMVASTNTNRFFGWGWNNAGEVGDNTRDMQVYPTEGTANLALNPGENIIFVAAGYSSSFVFTDDNRFFSWGNNNSGILANGSTTSVFDVTDHTSSLSLLPGEYLVSMDTEYQSALALSNLGNLYGWGGNYNGELYLGNALPQTSAVLLSNEFTFVPGETITDYAAGDGFNVVATSEGNVYTAGKNTYGFLGDGTSVAKTTPTNIKTIMGLNTGEYVTSLDSDYHTIAATNSGRIFAWGYNTGAIGPASTYGTSVHTPVELSSGFTFENGEYGIGVTVGYTNSYVFTNLGNFFAWGSNGVGQLGFGYPDIPYVYVPTKAPRSFDIVNIQQYLPKGEVDFSQNYSHALFLGTNNQVYGWGDNTYGVLGFESDREFYPINITPYIPLNPSETVIDVETGNEFSVLLTSEYRVLTAGRNNYGQLGTDDYTNKNYFVDITANLQLPPPDFVTNIFVGKSNTFLITNEGEVYAFGYNLNGQLAIGNRDNRNIPTNITANLNLNLNEKVIDISQGIEHTLFYTNQERLLSVGDNTYGQLGDGTYTDSLTPLLIDVSGCYDTSLNTIIDLESGDNFSGFITDDGGACIWGLNDGAMLGEGGLNNRNVPFSITNQFPLNPGEYFTNLSIGSTHSVMVTSEGNVFSWGLGDYYKLGTGYTFDEEFPQDITSNIGISNIDHFVLGEYTSFFITSTGNLYVFGSSVYGQLGLGNITSSSTPSKVSKDENELKEIRFIDMQYEQYLESSFVYLDLYFNYDLKDTLQAVTINGTLYPILEFDSGKVTVLIPNTYSLNDPLDYEVQLLHLNEGIVAPDGPNRVYGVILNDVVPPTYDVINNQYYPVGTSDVDFTTLITNLEDNSLGPITLSEVDTVDYNTIGEYSVTVTATDEAGNFLTRQFYVYITDTTPPEITYTGQTSFPVGATYNFLDYATALDNYDGDITGSIELIAPIDFYTAGDYTITFNVQDSAGNQASLDVIITIEDTIPPTFDPIQDQAFPVLSIMDVDWTTLMYNLNDNVPGEITTWYEDDILYFEVGFYTVTVYAMDEVGNTASQTFNVYLYDDEPPMVMIADIIYIYPGEYIDFSYYFYNIIYAYDDVDGDITWAIMIDDSMVDYMTPGFYEYYAMVSDMAGNIGYEQGYIQIMDNTPPTFDPILDLTFEINQYPFFDWLSLVTNLQDDFDPYPDVFITFEDVLLDQVGEYHVTIEATDSSYNTYSQTFTVYIVDSNAPIITPIDDQQIPVSELEYNWLDLLVVEGEDINNLLITIDDQVQYGILGTYTITIDVTDDGMNTSSVSFDVTVYDDIAPEITYDGPTTITVEAGTIFTPPIIECIDNYDETCTILQSGIVDTSIIGQTVLLFEATDTSDNTSSITITIDIVDITSPEVTLVEGLDTITVGETHTDGGISIIDIQDTETVLETDLDTTTPGTYYIRYIVTDDSGNETILKRIITVLEEPTIPIFEFDFTNAVTTLDIGFDFVEASCEVTIDGTTYDCLVDSTDVNNQVAGTYEVIYYIQIEAETYSYTIYVTYVESFYIVLYYYKEEWEVTL